MRKTWTGEHMGTVVSITLRNARPDDYAEIVKKSFEFFKQIDEAYSPFREDSLIGELRKGHILDSLRGKFDYLEEIIEISQDAETETQGFFSPHIPDLKTGKTFFNPTGMIKGWTLGKVSGFFKDLPETAFVVSAGGDMQLGGNYDDKIWNIGIQDPEDKENVSHLLELSQGAIATSGTQERGKHIYSPFLKNWPTFRKSVTVVGDNILWADIWATALFIADDNFVQNFKNRSGWKVICQ